VTTSRISPEKNVLQSAVLRVVETPAPIRTSCAPATRAVAIAAAIKTINRMLRMASSSWPIDEARRSVSSDCASIYD
jgi:hypothetical protein